jgi:hypothetical protein
MACVIQVDHANWASVFRIMSQMTQQEVDQADLCKKAQSAPSLAVETMSPPGLIKNPGDSVCPFWSYS